MITIDAEGAVAGRLAAYVAKKLLQKEQVTIINVEKAVFSGNPDQIIGVYYKRRGMTNKANPEKARKWPRRPDFFFKNIVFGMLPRTNRRKQLLANLKAHIGAPAPAAEPTVVPPRTGVEIVSSDVRKGVRYYSVRDLRNMRVVHNVTLASARRLWQYAIEEAEKNPCNPRQVQWVGDIGIWKAYKRGGKSRQDLVQRVGDKLFVYYGVTEDGIHGPWRKLVEGEAGAEAEEAPEIEPHTEVGMPTEIAAEYEEAPAPAAEAIEEPPEEIFQPPMIGDEVAESYVPEATVVAESPAATPELGATEPELPAAASEPVSAAEVESIEEPQATETLPSAGPREEAAALPAPELSHELAPRESTALVPKSRAQAWREKLDKAMAEARAAQLAAAKSQTEAKPRDEGERSVEIDAPKGEGADNTGANGV